MIHQTPLYDSLSDNIKNYTVRCNSFHTLKINNKKLHKIYDDLILAKKVYSDIIDAVSIEHTIDADDSNSGYYTYSHEKLFKHMIEYRNVSAHQIKLINEKLVIAEREKNKSDKVLEAEEKQFMIFHAEFVKINLVEPEPSFMSSFRPLTPIMDNSNSGECSPLSGEKRPRDDSESERSVRACTHNRNLKEGFNIAD